MNKQNSLKFFSNSELNLWLNQREFFYLRRVTDFKALKDIYQYSTVNRSGINGYKLGTFLGQPKFGFLVFSTSCLRNCLFCSCAKESFIFEKLDLKKLLVDLAKIKYGQKIFFVSPEPFIHPQFLEIVKICQKNFGQIECYGCPEFLADWSYALAIKKLGVSAIQLGLYSSKPEIHDLIVGRQGNFELLIKTIENLKKLKIKTYIFSILLKHNIENINQDRDFVKNKLKLPYVVIPLRQREMSDKDFFELSPSFSQWKSTMANLDSLLGFPLCFGSSQSPHKIKSDELSDILKFALFFSLLDYTKLEKCRQCKLNIYCPGVLRSHLKLYPLEKFLKPFR